MTEVHIDKGVPVPRRSAVLPWGSMAVGDSVVFDRRRQGTVASYASVLKKRTGKEFTIKTISDTECRLWRIK